MSFLSGAVATEIGRNINLWMRLLQMIFSKLFFLTPEGGAQTTLHCALQEGLEPLSGRYFTSCTLHEVSDMARDDGLAKKLWEVSERMCGLSWERGMRGTEECQERKRHQIPYEQQFHRGLLYDHWVPSASVVMLCDHKLDCTYTFHWHCLVSGSEIDISLITVIIFQFVVLNVLTIGIYCNLSL